MKIKEILSKFNIIKKGKDLSENSQILNDIFDIIKEKGWVIDSIMEKIPEDIKKDSNFWKDFIKNIVIVDDIYIKYGVKILMQELENKYLNKKEIQEIYIYGLKYQKMSYLKNERELTTFLDKKLIWDKSDLKAKFFKLLSEEPKILYTLSDEMKKDREVVLCFAKNILSTQIEPNYLKLPKEIGDDDEIMNLLIKKEPSCIKLASDRIASNKKLIKNIIKKSPEHFSLCNQSIQEDKEIALIALNGSKNNFQFVRGNLRRDKEVILTALKSNYKAIDDLESQFYADRDIIKEAIKGEGRMIRYASDELKNDKELAKMAINHNFLAYLDIGEEAKKDETLFFKTLEASLKYDRAGYNFTTLYERSPFKDDFDVTLRVLKKFKKNIVPETKELRGNKDFILKALDHMNVFGEAKNLFNDDEVIKKALKWKENIVHVDKSNKHYRDNIVDAIINIGVIRTEFDHIKHDRDILKELFEEIDRITPSNNSFEKRIMLFFQIIDGRKYTAQYMILSFDILKNMDRGKKIIPLIFNESYDYLTRDRTVVEAFIKADENNLLLIKHGYAESVEFLSQYKDIIVKNKDNKDWEKLYSVIEMFDREDMLNNALSNIKKQDGMNKRKKI